MLTDLDAVFDVNISQASGIAAIYQTLLGGVPSIEGFTFLIGKNITTNFGAGLGPTFNDENIFINLTNTLIQGNNEARQAFEAQASGLNLIGQITSLYETLIPQAKQSADGLSYLIRQEGLEFYQQVADERGIEGSNGAAIIAMASLLRIIVEQKIGVGDAVQDFISAVKNGSAMLPSSSLVVIPIETADGTDFDADDVQPGSTFFLTSNIDTILGTAGNDLILGGRATLTTDIIDGKGGIDTLRILDTIGIVFTPTLNSVENLEINAVHTSNTVLNLGLSSDVSNVTLYDGGGSLSVTGAKKIHDLTVSNTSDVAAIVLSYDAAVIAGTDDTQKIILETTDLGGGIAIDGVETINITQPLWKAQ